MAIPLKLRVLKGEQTLAEREFHRDIIKIGRLASAHLCLEDERVSRIHAVIEVSSDGTVSIIDMGSVEGTYVSGKRVSKAPLSSGDVISVGDTKLEITIGAAEAAKAAPGNEAVAVPVGLVDQQAAAPQPQVEAAATPAPAAAPVPQAPMPQAAPVPPAAHVPQAAQAPHVPQSPQPPQAAAVPQQTVAPQAPAASVEQIVAQIPAQPANVAQHVPQSIAPHGSAGATVGYAPPPNSMAALWAAEAAREASTPRRLPALRPAPLPRELSGSDLLLDVRLYWGDTQIAVATFDEEEKVTVGSAAESSLLLEADLPADPFPLARKIDGSWVVTVPPGRAGELTDGSGSRPLSQLAGSVLRRGEEAGTWELNLEADAAVSVDLGHVRAELCYRPRPKQAIVPVAERFDYRFLNIFLVAFFLGFGAIVGFTNSSYGEDLVQDDLYNANPRFAKVLFEEAKKERTRANPFLERMKLKAPGEAAAKAAGVEGKMGKKDAPKRNTRSAPRAIDPKDKEQVANQGVLAMLNGKNAGLSTIFGKGGLGGDLKGAIGNITGNSVGDAHGFGGLGLKGTGPGGGGISTKTIGVGDVGTKGRGGGKAGYGSGVGGLGRKGSADVTISTSEATVVGYDRELVRRVVAAHKSQLQYCYESELIRSPNLSGRIAVKWVIGQGGRVTQANVASNSMGSAKVANCIVTRVKSWNFPPPKGGGVAIVTYPFVFRPAGK